MAKPGRWPNEIALPEEQLGEIQAVLMGLTRFCQWVYKETRHPLAEQAVTRAKYGEKIAREMRSERLPGGKDYREGDDG